VFTQNQSGGGAGIIVDGVTNLLNGSDHPAHAGDFLVIYCTGLGAVTPAVPTGTGATGLSSANAAVKVSIGGKTADVAFAGLTPGFPGLYQINTMVPQGVQTGDAIPVVVSAGAVNSPPVGLTIR
jgi:adhesin/invasin